MLSFVSILEQLYVLHKDSAVNIDTLRHFNMLGFIASCNILGLIYITKTSFFQ